MLPRAPRAPQRSRPCRQSNPRGARRRQPAAPQQSKGRPVTLRNPRAMPRTSRARLTKAGKEKAIKGKAASCVGHVRLPRPAAAPRTSPQQSTRSQPGPGSGKKLQVLARNSVHPRRRLRAYPGARRAPRGVRAHRCAGALCESCPPDPAAHRRLPRRLEASKTCKCCCAALHSRARPEPSQRPPPWPSNSGGAVVHTVQPV